MLQVLGNVLFSVFAVVAVGFGVARAFDIRPSALATLSYWILGPAFIFDVLATAELDPESSGGLWSHQGWQWW